MNCGEQLVEDPPQENWAIIVHSLISSQMSDAILIQNLEKRSLVFSGKAFLGLWTDEFQRIA